MTRHIVILSLLLTAASATAAVPGVRHVVIIGVDGMSPDGVKNAKTPHMDSLRKRGASTLHARGVMPTSSSPNWASMIMGAGPEQHGVTSNDWEPDNFEIAPVAVGQAGRFPTIFGLLRLQQPSSVIAVFHDWKGFGRLVEPRASNVTEHCEGPAATVRRAIAYFQASRPALAFIHLDHVDHAGHEIGHGTPRYYEAVTEADRLIGEIIQGLLDAGMLGQTIVIITADHGGVGKKHGGPTMAEIEIPWIISGPGVAAGRRITAPVNTFDTAATVAWIFGLTPPEAWIGRPVLAAFTAASSR